MRAVLIVGLLTLGGCTRHLPTWSPVDPASAMEVLGTEGPVSMARVRLEASQTFRFEASPCVEILVFVEEGVARASLSWVQRGSAARFRAPAVLQAMSDEGATLFAVSVNHAPPPGNAATWRDEGPPGACPVASPDASGSPKPQGPFLHASGKLSVMIYLDGEGSSLGSLTADPTLSVPEHIHQASAEILWFDSGAGTMRLGDETVLIDAPMFVYVPAGVLHGFIPNGEEPLLAYQVYAPSGPEQRFRK
ncbi:MAG: cupin domain-containing protein [Polyangiales bacterium]